MGASPPHAQDGGDGERVNALTDLSALPAGLEAIYEYFFVLLRDTVSVREGPGWRQTGMRCIGRLHAVLAVAQAPLTIKSLGMPTGTSAVLRHLPISRNSSTAMARERGFIMSVWLSSSLTTAGVIGTWTLRRVIMTSPCA